MIFWTMPDPVSPRYRMWIWRKVVRHAVGFLTQEGQEHGVVGGEFELPAGYVVQGDRDLLVPGLL
jgi:hypothetical protein